MILHVAEAGAGPPVALLHGLFGRARNLGGVARHLAAEYRVISLDLRNHGASPHAAGMAYSVLASDVLETLAAMNGLPAFLLGHSMGGKAAMAAALSSPAAVRGLVVADIAPVAYAHHNRAVAAALLGLDLRPGLTRAEAAAALEGDVPEKAVRDFLLQNLVFGTRPSWLIGLADIAEAMGDIEDFPDYPAAAQYDRPALFLRGGVSDYVLPAHEPVIRLRFPRARVQTLEGAGHWLHADRPEAFMQAVQAFLKACC